MYRYNNGNNQWESFDDTSTLRIADRIKTVLTIETRRPLNYVFINDQHAAALDASDGSSRYEYDNGFSYYRSVRDAGMQFFAEKIPAGVSTISYEMVVAKEGFFSDGMTSLQCMYQPAVRAYCAGNNIRVIE